MKYTRKNHNGTYRIPLQALSSMEKMIEIDGGPSPCLIGELVDLIGKYEELGEYNDIKRIVSENV